MFTALHLRQDFLLSEFPAATIFTQESPLVQDHFPAMYRFNETATAQQLWPDIKIIKILFISDGREEKSGGKKGLKLNQP